MFETASLNMAWRQALAGRTPLFLRCDEDPSDRALAGIDCLKHSAGAVGGRVDLWDGLPLDGGIRPGHNRAEEPVPLPKRHGFPGLPTAGGFGTESRSPRQSSPQPT